MTDLVENRESSFSLKEGEIHLVLAEKTVIKEVIKSLGVGTLEKKESGEPYLVDSPFYVSLSHKGDTAVAAISKTKIGVDMEDVTIPRNVERLSRLFDQAEAPDTLYDFYKVWTAKEAMGKLLGTGITVDLLKQHISGVRHLDYGNYVIAVAGEGDITIQSF